MRNRDGTVSIVTNLLDHAAPANVAPSGTPASAIGPAGMASISRYLAGRVKNFRTPTVNRELRTAELILRDPARFW